MGVILKARVRNGCSPGVLAPVQKKALREGWGLVEQEVLVDQKNQGQRWIRKIRARGFPFPLLPRLTHGGWVAASLFSVTPVTVSHGWGSQRALCLFMVEKLRPHVEY